MLDLDEKIVHKDIHVNKNVLKGQPYLRGSQWGNLQPSDRLKFNRQLSKSCNFYCKPSKVALQC